MVVIIQRGFENPQIRLQKFRVFNALGGAGCFANFLRIFPLLQKPRAAGK
jgi:hypothetical protein